MTNLTDAWLSRNFSQASEVGSRGMSLVAVGGYGRGELLPGSDLDVLLLHHDNVPGTESTAEYVFYPIWDAGLALDHAVRTPEEAVALAKVDMKVVLGLIDARHIVGDETLTAQVRADVRHSWRQTAEQRLPELASMVRGRAATVGELAHLLEPDLVKAYGGLRDSLALRAVAASWVADQPHTPGIDEAREWLLAVRDALHRATKRRHDRLVFEDQADVAARLGLAGPDALLRRVAEAGRRIAYASDVTWRSVDRALAARKPLRRRQVLRRPLAHGVVEHDGEAALAQGVVLDTDATLPLRAAAAAAQAGLTIGPQTLGRLKRECPPLPEPWPDSARDALVGFLGAGHAAVPVWESLDAAGFVVTWFPEWEPIRFLPTRTPVHRHTVDRHLVESAAEAAGLARRVTRPDLLLLAALFHDLGKRGSGDHSVAGEAIVAKLSPRLGLDADDSETLARLVRHHLLLPEMATRRDPDDPATIDTVVKAVGDRDFLDLLAALTEADATAAGQVAWSPLRSSLIGSLVARVRDVLAGGATPDLPLPKSWQVDLARSGEVGVRTERIADGQLGSAPNLAPPGRARVAVGMPAAAGAVAIVSGALAMNGMSVRAAHLHTVDEGAVLECDVVTRFGRLRDDDRLRHDIERAVAGTLDLEARLAGRPEPPGRVIRHAAPQVNVLAHASADASVVEVRAHDKAGLLYRVASAIVACGVVIRSAVIETLGAEAIDVFYIVKPNGSLLTRDELSAVRSAALSVLQAQ